MQMLGGASDSVPTVSTPGVPSPRAPALTAPSGATLGVVYLSSPGPAAADARFVGTALALSTPGGAHWSASAPAGTAIGRLNTSSATSARTNALALRPVKRVIRVNVAATAALKPPSAHSERNRWLPGQARRVEHAAAHQFGDHDAPHRLRPADTCSPRTVGVVVVDGGRLLL